MSALEDVINNEYSHMMTDTFNNLKMGPAESEKYIKQQWEKLRQDCAYEIDYFGDLLIQAISRGAKKMILIVNTDINSTNDPVVVVSPETFGGERDSDLPVIVAYNGHHYESLEPCDADSNAATKVLCEKYKNGEYKFKRADIETFVIPYNTTEKKQRSRGTPSNHAAAALIRAQGSARSSVYNQEIQTRRQSRQENPEDYAKEKRIIVDQKRQSRKENPQDYAEEKRIIVDQKRQSRQENQEDYAKEKRSKVDQRRRSRQENPEGYANEKRTKVVQRRQNKEEQLIKKINTDTGFDSICAVCCEFKSKASTVPLDILTKSEIEKHAWRIEQNREINGSFSVCDLCRKAIKKSEAPPKKPQHNPQLTDFPKTLLNSVVKISGSESPRLNKLEGFLLKLVIPFIRVANCVRGPHFQVKGSLILISSDIKHSLQRILPLTQEIIPVKFKRKLRYDGYYIGEYVDKNKVQLYHEWLKTNNHLYAEIDLDNDVLENFQESIETEAEDVLRACSKSETEATSEEVTDDLDDEIDLLLDTDHPGEVENSVNNSEPIRHQNTTCMMNKYEKDLDAPTVSNRLAKLICHLEKKNIIGDSIPDEVDLDCMSGDQIPEFYPDCEVPDEVSTESENVTVTSSVFSKNSREKNVSCDRISIEQTEKSAQRIRKEITDNLRAVSVAPGEHGEWVNWKEDVYLEEKCFPELFPRGIGGYLSTCIATKKNVGFANYCRSRLKSSDAKFRNSHIYIFFLQLVKESIALESAVATNLRQARNTKGLSKQMLGDMRFHDLERFARKYSAFKKCRGTSPYFEAAKKDLFATIRQRGAPSLFVTLSAGKCYHH